MSDWYYVRGEERVGPLSESEIAQLVATGALRPDTPVWSAGMTSWTPAREAKLPTPTRESELSTTTELDGPSADPGHQAMDPATTSAWGVAGVHPWRRWLARIMDLGIFGFVTGVAGEVVAPGVFIGMSTLVLNLLLLVLWQPLEALLLHAFGTTPGKRLLRISISKDGFRLSYWTALRRSFRVWIRGLGAGLPIISLFTMALSYNALRNDGSTSWDADLGVAVYHQPISAIRWLGVVIVCVLYALLTIYGSLPAS